MKVSNKRPQKLINDLVFETFFHIFQESLYYFRSLSDLRTSSYMPGLLFLR